MHELEADIRWHEEQIRLARAALQDADQLANPTRELEVALLASSIQKLERTMGHLEELRTKRA